MRVDTPRKQAVVDVTDELEVPAGRGVLHVFVQHTTCALIINEFEKNLQQDFLEAYTNLLPAKKWLHDSLDGNAQAHLLAALLGPSVSVPYAGGALLLGRWQRVLLVEFDGPRTRKIKYVPVSS